MRCPPLIARIAMAAAPATHRPIVNYGIARASVLTNLPFDVARKFGRTELAKDLEKKLNP